MKTRLLFVLFFVGAIRLFAQETKQTVAIPSCGLTDENIDPSVMKFMEKVNY